MNGLDDHIPIQHQRLKSELVVSVLVSDWNDIVEEVDEIEAAPVLWGNLAFTVLGFGLSVVLSVGLYHLTTEATNAAVLGFGYGVGPLLMVAAVPLYLLQQRNPKDPLVIRHRLQKLIAKVEAKQEETSPNAIEPASHMSVTQPRSAKELKEKAFRHLVNPRTLGDDDG